MVSVGGLPGGTFSQSYGMNTDGSTLVGTADSVGGLRAFRWTNASGSVNLGTLPGGSYSRGQAVSADGQFVVGNADIATGSPHAFRWRSADSTMQNLGTLSGSPTGYSYGRAISNDGWAVLGQSDSALGDCAFIWTPTLGMVDLNDYLAARGTNLAGWRITDCRGISADGTTLVGSGLFNGEQRAFVVQRLSPITATPACVADFNHNGATTADDIFAFLEAWFAGLPTADVNHSGAADVSDIFAFLALWFAGC